MTVFARGPLTDFLIDSLDALPSPLLVGDHIAPEDGGWTGGEPGQGSFVPYVVLTTGTAGQNFRDTIGVDAGSWRATYSIRAVGATRSQCDWAADKAQALLSEIRKVTLVLGINWRLQQIVYDTKGGISRNDSTDPAYFEQVDTISVWLDVSTS